MTNINGFLFDVLLLLLYPIICMYVFLRWLVRISPQAYRGKYRND